MATVLGNAGWTRRGDLWDGACPLCGDGCRATAAMIRGKLRFRCEGGKKSEEIEEALQRKKDGDANDERTANVNRTEKVGMRRPLRSNAVTPASGMAHAGGESGPQDGDAKDDGGRLRDSEHGAVWNIPDQARDRPVEVTAPAADVGGVGGGRAKPQNRPEAHRNGKASSTGSFAAGNGAAGGESALPDVLRRVPPQNIDAEMSVLGAILLDNEAIAAVPWPAVDAFYRESHRVIYRAMQELRARAAAIDAITLSQALKTAGTLEAVGGAGYIGELAAMVPTARNIEHYAAIVRDMAYKRDKASKFTQLASLAFDGVSADALEGEIERVLREPSPVVGVVPWEDYGAALEANEAYLRRTPVIDRLCYSSAVSMITGGKHAGKSTLARWMAVCVAKGWPFLKRDVTQGPVFYIASEDETMAARQELIRLGWTSADTLRFLSAQNINNLENPDEFLARLTSEIKATKAVLVVLDMLFDFVRIADEMSYAGTREAVGRIQQVATEAGSHIVAIHHAPKNAQIGDAAVAALGSQGLAARVSPIILVRRFGPGVHSISSTSVRDPRGEPLIESRLVRNDDGSVELAGVWKNYMLAEVYAGRVRELLEAEIGSEMTAAEVSESLDISYQVAKSTLSMLFRQRLIERDGEGKKGKPFRYSASISAPNAREPDSEYGTGRGDVPNPSDAENAQNWGDQGRFGYKD